MSASEANIMERFKSLEGRFDDLGGKLEKMNIPNLERKEGQESLSYWGGTEEAIVRRAPRKNFMKDRLPKGYKRFKVWDSANSFYKELVQNGSTAEFRAKMKDASQGIYKAVQGMSEGIGSDGGFAILPEYSSEIKDRVYSNGLFNETDNYTIAGNTLTFLRTSENSRANGSRAGGVTGTWAAEGASVSSSKVGLAEFRLQLHKLMVVVYLTQELIDDAGMALEQYVNKKVSEEFNFKVGDAIFNGTGAGQPLGILSANARVTADKRANQTANTILVENVWDMWSRLQGPAMPNAKWYINQDTYPQLFGMKMNVGTGGAPVFLPAQGVSEAPYGTLLGRPIEVTEFNSTVGTEGDIILANLNRGYVTISKGGISQAVSMHVEFLTDQMALRFTLRVDGQPWESAPLTPYKGTATQGNFVTLETRS